MPDPVRRSRRSAWQRLSCGERAKDPRVYDWAAAKLPTNLIFEIAYHLAYAPIGIELAELGRVASSRWAIE